MNILLVKPGFGSLIEGYNLNDGRMEPLALGVLAGLTPPEHTVRLMDDRTEDIDFQATADLVAISVDTFNSRRAYQIADGFRAQGVPVCLGGVHVSLLPGEAEDHADVLLMGDAEQVWQGLLEDLENQRLKPRYQGPFTTPQAGTFPVRSLFSNRGYLPISLIQYSRGCPFNCSHCSVAKVFGHAHNFRPVEEVVEEIKRDKLKFLLFVDDNITANPERAKELFEALIPLQVPWASQASIDMVTDPELMDLMARSGCIGQLIGFESINEESLQWMNKRVNLRDFDFYQEAVQIIRNYGLQTWASFIVGGDQDTPESIRQTVAFSIQSKFTLGFFHMFSPYPATAIYDQFAKEGRLLYGGKWWLHPDYRYNEAAFIPKGMTPKHLGQLVVEANQRFYSLSSVGHRLWDRKTNLKSLMSAAFYLRYNYVMRATSV